MGVNKKCCAELAFLVAFAIGPKILVAHDVITTKLTYSRDISRIFQTRCVSCHGPSSSIPLATYEQVRPWAVGIKEQILSRKMPPWGAVKGFGNLSPDAGLTEEEILIIAGWVIGGAPEGDPKTLPRQAAPAVPPEKQLSKLQDALTVNQTKRLDRDLILSGIRPQPDAEVASAKITVTLPDGHTQPLLWLFHYDPKWNQSFRCRYPIRLPAGSVLQSDAPLRFVLQTQ